MLHTSAVNTTLFRILKSLMNIPELNDLLLVGGTSLALQLGHRKSIDINLFGKIEFNYDNLGFVLNEIGNVQVLSRSRHINILNIDDVKVDFVNYRYPWIDNAIYYENFRLASLKDIAAMKLNAITGRGSKKDFIDLYFLLDIFGLEEMFDFYTEKYDDGNIFLVEKSLFYFKDAENNKMPEMIMEVSWEQVKDRIKSLG